MEWEKVKKFVNLTPHELAFWIKNPDGSEKIIRVPKGDSIVRLDNRCEYAGSALGIPVVCCKEGKPHNLPAPEEGVVYLVSSLVAKKVLRDDVLCPDTSDDGAIRDGNGVIIAVKRLQNFR